MNYEIVARIIAEVAHGGHVRGDDPAISHPAYVAALMLTDEEKAVAWLHAVVEDTSLPLAYLRQYFPATICEAIYAITRRPGEAYTDYILRVRENDLARRVKIGDLRHNLLDAIPSLRLRYKTALSVLSKVEA